MTENGSNCQLSAQTMTCARETATSSFCGRSRMDILMLNEMEVQRLLDPDALLDALAEGFQALSSGLIDAPKRIGVSVPNTGLVLAMPAYQQGREVAVKLVSFFHQNNRLGLPAHQALFCLFDHATGTPVAFMDGTAITM